jgi:hypothetical protein
MYSKQLPTAVLLHNNLHLLCFLLVIYVLGDLIKGTLCMM